MYSSSDPPVPSHISQRDVLIGPGGVTLTFLLGCWFLSFIRLLGVECGDSVTAPAQVISKHWVFQTFLALCDGLDLFDLSRCKSLFFHNRFSFCSPGQLELSNGS